MTNSPLDGVGILVTRPQQQADELVECIEQAGGKAIAYPVIEILPRNAETVATEAADLGAPDIAIFISRNAVAHGLDFTASAKIAAVGPATAAAIEAAGKTVDIRPATGFDSESLLAETALQDVAGKAVRIIRGVGGRELLADTLRKRGAIVDYLEVYERRRPQPDVNLQQAIEKAWREKALDAVVVMSVESLHNLLLLLPAWCRERVDELPLVTPSQRVIKEALEVSPDIRIVQSSGPGAGQMLDAIIASQTGGPESAT